MRRAEQGLDKENGQGTTSWPAGSKVSVAPRLTSHQPHPRQVQRLT
jgi:hypothetical protein